jgi:hypothetical protein
VLAHAPDSPDLATCDNWLFAHVKEHFCGKWIELEDDINTAVMASVHHLTKDEYRAAIGKSVWTVLVITWGRWHSGISVVLWYCILLL